MKQEVCHGNWLCPRRGWTKLNSDAGWNKDTQQGTTGCIYRSDRREFVGALFAQLQFTTSALVAEAMAIHEGLKLAIEDHWLRLEVESDTKQLIQVLNRHQQTPVEIEVVAGDILHLANSLEAKFQYTSRASNNLAHKIAH
ncbi:hypothetical protein LIER_35286 [Lithospermum erythrorhizon]|uniref:RNase H type-1 domain-containing protein n=1 Tax=Lithospermum erythrorhizon TaxID=34254 RepID=A0AAV3NRW0_LITER